MLRFLLLLATLLHAGHAQCPEPGCEVPMICTGEWDPQCGCDGESYANPCQATCVNPTPIPSSGECPEPEPAPEPETEPGPEEEHCEDFITEGGCEFSSFGCEWQEDHCHDAGVHCEDFDEDHCGEQDECEWHADDMMCEDIHCEDLDEDHCGEHGCEWHADDGMCEDIHCEDFDEDHCEDHGCEWHADEQTCEGGDDHDHDHDDEGWSCGTHPADTDGNGVIDINDILNVLGMFGQTL